MNQAPANGLKAMFLCVEGETHDLGLKIAAALFREHGWKPGATARACRSMRGCGRDELAAGRDRPIRLDGRDLPAARTYEASLAELFHGPTIMIGGGLAAAYAAGRQTSERLVLATSLLDVSEWLQARQAAMPRRRSSGQS